jgi:hypothetical protein
LGGNIKNRPYSHRANTGKLGVVVGKTFDAHALPEDVHKAIEAGMADAWQAYAEEDCDGTIPNCLPIMKGGTTRTPLSAARGNPQRQLDLPEPQSEQ